MAGAYYEAAECERAWQRRRDAQMMERLQQVQGQSLPISGLQRWVQTVINRNARVQPGLRELRGRLANELIRQGARSDGRGRHAVDRVLEWGWGGAHGKTRMAKVSWLGFDLEGSGAPWEPTWMFRTSLTTDLQETDPRVTELAEGRERAAAARVPDPLRRRTPRIAGVSPEVGLAMSRGQKRGGREAGSTATKKARGAQSADSDQRNHTRGQKRAGGVSRREAGGSEGRSQGREGEPRQRHKR